MDLGLGPAIWIADLQGLLPWVVKYASLTACWVLPNLRQACLSVTNSYMHRPACCRDTGLAGTCLADPHKLSA